jgi:branched-chain amino acid transport system substrate-binding protein
MKAKLSGLLAATALVMSAGSADAQDILLGYLPSLAGPFATLSRTNEIAAQIAVDEINMAGGISGKKIRIVSFDTGGKPDQAVVGLRKLAEDDKVLAIVGPFSSAECRVVFPAAERARIVSMSMASSAPKLAEPYTYALRNTSDEAYMFQKVMKTLQDKKFAMKTAAVAYATDDVISKTMGELVLPSVLKQFGVELRGSVTFQTQAFDLSAQVSQLKADPTDLVAVGSGPEVATRLAQELRRQGVKGASLQARRWATPNLRSGWATTATEPSSRLPSIPGSVRRRRRSRTNSSSGRSAPASNAPAPRNSRRQPTTSCCSTPMR